MVIPKPKKTKTGYSIYLRLDGKCITLSDTSKNGVISKAKRYKSNYIANRQINEYAKENPSIRQCIDEYINNRDNLLSPATIRKLDGIAKNHFQDVIDRRSKTLTAEDWQKAVNTMLAKYSFKTVKTSYGLIKTVMSSAGYELPKVSFGKNFSKKDSDNYLEPEEITLFVKEAAKSKYCIPLLLALSSMRIGEIDGLMWDDLTTVSAKISKVRIMDKNNDFVIKDGAKTESSVRTVDILIPELKTAIKVQKKKSGKVMVCHQMTLRRECERVCNNAKIKTVTVHGLRHSFASLCAHLGMPMIVSQEIGGWANDKIMTSIYTHVASCDMAKGKKMLRNFYNKR